VGVFFFILEAAFFINQKLKHMLQFGKERIQRAMSKARKVVLYEKSAMICMNKGLMGDWGYVQDNFWVMGGDKTSALIEAQKLGVEVIYGEERSGYVQDYFKQKQ